MQNQRFAGHRHQQRNQEKQRDCRINGQGRILEIIAEIVDLEIKWHVSQQSGNPTLIDHKRKHQENCHRRKKCDERQKPISVVARGME